MNKHDKVYGSRIGRLKDLPYGQDELKFSEEFHNMTVNDWELIVFGGKVNSSCDIPADRLSEREKDIVASVVQWLGTPVGKSFLKDCGFKNDKGTNDEN